MTNNYYELTFAKEIEATTVYSLKVLVPIKWYSFFPL